MSYVTAAATVRQFQVDMGVDLWNLEDFTLRLGQVSLDIYCRHGI